MASARCECATSARSLPNKSTPAHAGYGDGAGRRELDVFFSTLPSVAEGFHLKTWRGGPDAGKPKLPPTAKGLIARGLMRLDTEGHFPRLFFTEAGLTALRAMMTDRRLADPKKFAHVRQELGIDPSSEDEA
jgi:hypothetical protein